MPCLQPEIMIVNGLDQDGPHAAAVCTEGIGKDLIAYQRRLIGRNAIVGKALLNTSAEGFFRMGDAIQPVGSAEFSDPIPFTVGNHTHLDIRTIHHS